MTATPWDYVDLEYDEATGNYASIEFHDVPEPPARLTHRLLPKSTAVGEEPRRTVKTSDGWTITQVRLGDGSWWNLHIERSR